MTLHLFDLLLALFMLCFWLLACARGLGSELSSWVALVAGFLLAQKLHEDISSWVAKHLPEFLVSNHWLQAVGWFLPIIAALIVAKILSLLSGFVPAQSFSQRLLAGISGLAKGGLVSLAIYTLLARLPVTRDWMFHSWSAPQLDRLANWVQRWI